MAFKIFGSDVKHRIHPKRFGRGPRGIVGKHSHYADVKAHLDARRTFDFAKPKTERGVFKTTLSRVKNFFARGNR
jgi:hypothetical protein